MKIYLCLTLMIIIAGCKCPFIHMVELGNNFALVQVDDTDILYDRKGKKECYFSTESTEVVPSEVIAYNYDERWIIAKSRTLKGCFYWIVDKQYNFSRLGYTEELKKQTIGPLDSLQFQKEKLKYNINLELRNLE